MHLRSSAILFALLGASASCGSDGGTTPISPTIARVTVSVVTAPPALLPGSTLQLTGTATSATGAVVNTAFSWSSSATAVATVDQTGKVTAVTPGAATITAEASGIRGTLALAVLPPTVATKDTIFTPGIAFSPNYLIVKAGSTVIFSLGFDGIGHDVRFDTKPGAPGNIPVSVRKNVPVTFSLAGAFHYICPTHPEMVGDVLVQ